MKTKLTYLFLEGFGWSGGILVGVAGVRCLHLVSVTIWDWGLGFGLSLVSAVVRRLGCVTGVAVSFLYAFWR